MTLARCARRADRTRPRPDAALATHCPGGVAGVRWLEAGVAASGCP
jgi:hypothetical protein